MAFAQADYGTAPFSWMSSMPAVLGRDGPRQVHGGLVANLLKRSFDSEIERTVSKDQ
jgi:hypothetical protein